MEEEYQRIKRIKIIKICGIIFSSICLGVVIYVVIISILRYGKIGVQIQYAPNNAAVFIDQNNQNLNNSTTYLEPGDHEIIVISSGFYMIKEKITISEENIQIYGSLIPYTEEAQKIASENQNGYGDVENKASNQAIKRGEEEKSRWPILKYLPDTNPAFGIGYILTDLNQVPTLTITGEMEYVDTAINKLRNYDKNISLSEYKIQINDFDDILANRFVKNNASNPRINIEQGYRNIGKSIRVDQGIQQDDLFATTIVLDYGDSSNDPNDMGSNYIPLTYRIVMKKEGNAWKLNSNPYPLLTTNNTPGVPTEILDKVNRQDSSA